MIRFLQKDNKVVKILFGVIIGAACVSMVVYLIPGFMDNSNATDATGIYATVHTPGVLGRIFGETTPVKTEDVERLAIRQLQQQHFPDSMMRSLLPYMMGRAGQVMVQRAIMKQEADRLHLQVSDEDLRRELSTGPFAQYLFPNGKFIGTDGYINFIQMAIGQNQTIASFESQVKEDMELQRLQALVTGGVTVSEAAVREAYRVQGTKVKFDYAVVSPDDIKKSINPSDADLQAFFNQNSARYANAIPETRKVQYAAFDAAKAGGKPAVSDAEVQAYYASHQEQYKSDEQVKTRHILITSKTGADAQSDAAAKAKAQDVLKQVQAGGNFAELAKKYSEDPGSKDQGGELPMVPTAQLDPAYGKAAMALNPGQTSGLVKSSFGYHIIQTEQKQAAGVKPLSEEKDSIVQTLQQQKAGAAEQDYAMKLAADAKANGLDKAAASRGLHVVTTDYVAKDGVIGGLSDATELLNQAFGAQKNVPATSATGDGFAVYQVLDVKPAHAPDFAEYKAHVLDDFRAQKVPELVAQETRKLDDRAKVLNDLKKAADEMHIAVKSSDLVGQDGQVPDLGAMSGPASVAFSLPKGGISGAINTGQGGGIVLAVTDKQEPTAEETAKNFDQMRESLLNNQRNEIFSVFVGTITQKYQDSGAVKLTKAAQPPAGLPAGS